MGALRLSVGAPVGGVRLSAETEVNISGDARGKRYTMGGPPATSVYRETRRDVWWSFLGGIQLWEPHRVGSVHVVAGMSYVKPVVAATAQTLGPVRK